MGSTCGFALSIPVKFVKKVIFFTVPANVAGTLAGTVACTVPGKVAGEVAGEVPGTVAGTLAGTVAGIWFKLFQLVLSLYKKLLNKV